MNVEKVVFDTFAPKETTKAQKGGTSFSEVLQDSIKKVTELEKEANEQAEKLVKMEGQDVETQ